jgi:hypothetical protein
VAEGKWRVVNRWCWAVACCCVWQARRVVGKWSTGRHAPAARPSLSCPLLTPQDPDTPCCKLTLACCLVCAIPTPHPSTTTPPLSCPDLPHPACVWPQGSSVPGRHLPAAPLHQDQGLIRCRQHTGVSFHGNLSHTRLSQVQGDGTRNYLEPVVLEGSQSRYSSIGCPNDNEGPSWVLSASCCSTSGGALRVVAVCCAQT